MIWTSRLPADTNASTLVNSEYSLTFFSRSNATLFSWSMFFPKMINSIGALFPVRTVAIALPPETVTFSISGIASIRGRISSAICWLLRLRSLTGLRWQKIVPIFLPSLNPTAVRTPSWVCPVILASPPSATSGTLSRNSCMISLPTCSVKECDVPCSVSNWIEIEPASISGM